MYCLLCQGIRPQVHTADSMAALPDGHDAAMMMTAKVGLDRGPFTSED